MNKWKEIWGKREIDLDKKSILAKLIRTDGFDTGYGTIEENDWLNYILNMKQKLSIKNFDSIFEVGCGAGAFLYHFHEKNHKIAGIDYSEKLIAIAKEHLPNGEFNVCEAIDLNTESKYEYVVSNSVFFYFPNYEYALNVIKRMIQKSNKMIAILEVNDIDKKEESILLRKAHLTEEEYKIKYEGLEHLYYSKQWFKNIAVQHNLEIEIEQQNINNYLNNKYRFNVFMKRKESSL